MIEMKLFQEWIEGLLQYVQEVDEDGLYDIDRLETYSEWDSEGFSCDDSRLAFIKWVNQQADEFSTEDFKAIDNLVKLWKYIYKNVKVDKHNEVHITFRKQYEQF